MQQFRRRRSPRQLLFAALCSSLLLASALLPAQQQPAPSPQSAEKAHPVQMAVITAQMAVITRIDCTSTSAPVRVLIEFDRPVRYYSELLLNPDRLYFDFEQTRPTGNLRMTEFGPCRGLIPRVRVAEHEPGTTRVVLYLSGKISYE